MAVDLVILAKELANDPKAVGYAAMAPSAVAAAMNLRGGLGADVLQASSLDRDEFVVRLAPVIAAIASQPPAVQAKWDRIRESLPAVIDFGSSSVKAMVGQAIADGLATIEQFAAMQQRACSRAEALFGEGGVIFEQDIINALASRATPFDGLPQAVLLEVDASGLAKPTLLPNNEKEWWLSVTVNFVLGENQYRRELNWFFHDQHNWYQASEVYPTDVYRGILEQAKAIRSLHDLAASLQGRVGQDIMPLIAGLPL